jgi:eukaryotic-like serine/threonine-protein kinase
MSTNEKLVPGMVLGRYELLLPIAQGGMATVWAARQRGTRGFNKTVAIKTMLPTLTEDPQFEQMFLDEAALAAKIHHPNVAEILDLGEQDEVLYIVMEWVDGEALSVIHKATRKNQGQIPIRLSMRIAMQASAALHAAHELRDENDVPLMLVHRDVSPQNILCTYDGIVKLVDFGVAKATGRAGGETSAGQLKGKVPYMSPEQARGGNVDRRTDIFAMGIVLYKLTTGLHPFLGENDLVTMRNIISRPLLPPRVKNPGFPPEVEQILIKCLQKDPEKRYQTMAELGLAVERALHAMGIADDELGGYVRTLMGDRGAKRRAAIRDAARAADERFATGTYPSPVATPQTVHEGVSEVVLTKMSSGVKEELLPEGPASASAPPASISQPTQSGAWSQPQPESSGTTDQPVVASQQIPGLRKSRSGLFVVAGVVAAASILGVVLLRSGGSSDHGHGAPTAQAAQQPPPPITATAVTPPPAPVPTVEPTSKASASASSTSTAVDVNRLPDAQPPPHRSGPMPPAPSAKPSAAPDKPPSKVCPGCATFASPGF